MNHHLLLRKWRIVLHQYLLNFCSLHYSPLLLEIPVFVKKKLAITIDIGMAPFLESKTFKIIEDTECLVDNEEWWFC